MADSEQYKYDKDSNRLGKKYNYFAIVLALFLIIFYIYYIPVDEAYVAATISFRVYILYISRDLKLDIFSLILRKISRKSLMDCPLMLWP